MPTPLRAVALVCTLKSAQVASSSELLATQVLDELATHGVEGESIRVIDHAVAFGVETDMGSGDGWPEIREKVLEADIVILATPIWMGHAASISQQVLERLDAELSETDDRGRPVLFDKVALVAVVGNEDGAHKASADILQGLSDVGFTLPAQGVTYWTGEAMHTIDYQDLASTPEKVASTTATAARNAAHLATLLSEKEYPAS
ncbi:MAG: NAD(P)H-dependent oxidoreductase [Microbacteriaceae bacterium]